MKAWPVWLVLLALSEGVDAEQLPALVFSAREGVATTPARIVIDSKGFVWDHGQITNLTFPGGVGSQAFDVNERGQVVGVSRTAAGPSHAFLWDRGTLVDLGVPADGRSSSAFVINARGQIAGAWRASSGQQRPFIVTPTN